VTDSVASRPGSQGDAGTGRTGASSDPRAAGERPSEDARQLIDELYRTNGLTLVRVAMFMVGDKPTAEDVVHEAFLGLYRAVSRLTSTDKALAYLRVCVVNGCRSVHRARRTSALLNSHHEPSVWSAESAAMAREESRLTLQAVARLPRRAREVLALRYYLGLSDPEIAAALRVSRGTVSSTASRALRVLASDLNEYKEEP
jgi:RNA polymerase sigma factor (sigma-70 family)